MANTLHVRSDDKEAKNVDNNGDDDKWDDVIKVLNLVHSRHFTSKHLSFRSITHEHSIILATKKSIHELTF